MKIRIVSTFQELYRRLKTPNELPNIADIRGRELYYAQVELHEAELAQELAHFEAAKADALVEALDARVYRLSDGLLPRVNRAGSSWEPNEPGSTLIDARAPGAEPL